MMAAMMNGRLLHGDCLEVLPTLPDASVDLIYIDPPFFTQREHSGRAGVFNDAWPDLPAYVDWLAARIALMHRVLAPTGAVYVHLDGRASHYLKLRCDDIFGYDNFRNEIHWRRDVAGKGAKRGSGQWPRNTDNILVYSKSAAWHFEQPFNDLTDAQARNYRYTDADGRRFKTVMLGDYSPTSIARLESEGLIYVSSSGKKYKKYFLDEARATIDCLWTDIPGFGTRTASKERLGYPTQKPEALLERIIAASSKPGDLVADFFCGSGTTCAVANRLGRRWLGCDASATAIELATSRLQA